MRGSRASHSPTNHDFPDSYSATDGAKFIMQQKPPLCNGQSDLMGAKSHKIAVLKARADELGLMPYAGLYGDRRRTATWLKLLEHEPELQPLHPRVIEKSSQFNWKLAIALSVGAIALLCLLQPLHSNILPIDIDIKIQFTGQK